MNIRLLIACLLAATAAAGTVHTAAVSKVDVSEEIIEQSFYPYKN